MSEKIAPVQGYAAGIPWSMHLKAYDAYCKKHGPQQALIEGGCRGGFGDTELDMFIPGWRDELSELSRLRAINADMLAALEATEALDDRDSCEECEGEGEPESCGLCFPKADAARIKRRAAIAKANSNK